MTTDVVHSIGSGKDYTSISAWLAACPSDLTAVDERWVGEFYLGEMTLTSTPTLAATCSKTQGFVLRAASGQSFAANASAATNALRYNPANGAAIVQTGSYCPVLNSSGSVYVEVTGLQLRNNGAGNSNWGLDFHQGSHLGGWVHECVISINNATTTGVAVSLWCAGGNGYGLAENVLAVNESTGGATVTMGSGTQTVRNCTIASIGGGDTAQPGVRGNYGSVNVYNNAIFGFTPFVNDNTGAVGSNNITDRTSWGTKAPSSPGTTGAAFTTANFVALSGVKSGSGTGYDFRIPSGSALKDAGSTANGSAIDILGTTRPQGTTSDIGPYEYPVSSGGGALSGTAAVAASASGTLSGLGALAGTGAGTASAAGTLSGSGALTGTAAASAAANGALAGIGLLSGTATATTSAAGALTGTGALSGAAAASATATGTLTSPAALIGTATAAASATGTLTGFGALTGAAAAVAAATGILAGSGALSGTAAATAGASASLVGVGAVSGTAAVVATASGTLTGLGALSGTAAATAAATGSLSAAASGALSGTAAAVASASGTLTGNGALTGTAVAAAAASGTLQGFGPITGIAAATATAAGVLSGWGALTGAAGAVASASGTLSGGGTMPAVTGGRPFLLILG